MELSNANITGFDAAAIALNRKPNTSLNGTKAMSKEEARAAAQDFEAFFLSKMAETMFEGISTDGMFGGGHAEKVYRSLLVNEYGKAMAKNGSVGVARNLTHLLTDMEQPLARVLYEMESQGFINGQSAK